MVICGQRFPHVVGGVEAFSANEVEPFRTTLRLLESLSACFSLGEKPQSQIATVTRDSNQTSYSPGFCICPLGSGGPKPKRPNHLNTPWPYLPIRQSLWKPPATLL